MTPHRLAELIRFAQDRAMDNDLTHTEREAFRDIEALLRELVARKDP